MSQPRPTARPPAELPEFITARLVRPVQDFMRTEASSGIVLVVAAVAAIVWANSPWGSEYFDLLHRELALDLSWISIEEDVLHFINDGLMTIFFFTVGLEIKRELVHGELASPRRAALPAAAALGGMVVPALIYTALNAGTDASHGWGIPMATDIAFAVGVLSLLGNRIPFGVKVFLLALAIVDDLGAILVIAIFYTEAISAEALLIAAALLVIVITMSRLGTRNVWAYWAIGTLLWLAVFKSGVHATLAGVALAAVTPASPGETSATFLSGTRQLLDDFEEAHEREDHEATELYTARLEQLSRDTESPLDRLEHALLPWVSFVIVPIFALANAGLEIDGAFLSDAVQSEISLGVGFGLLVGKVAGIALFTFVVVAIGLGTLPKGMTFAHVLGVGLLGGIGFTVALFVTDLAFENPLFKDEAKAGVFAASILATLIGLGFLWLFSGPSGTGEVAGGNHVEVGGG